MDEGGERPPSCGWSNPNDALTIRGFAGVWIGTHETWIPNEMSTLSATSQLPLDKMSTHCFLLEQTASQLNGTESISDFFFSSFSGAGGWLVWEYSVIGLVTLLLRV
eukprot:1315985-Amorphochlora_amoeboformis.AAC.1